MAISLRQRRLVPEWMDQPDLETALHRDALAGLERINRISRSAGILWGPIARIARENPGEKLTLLDAATGGGDVPIALAHRARRAGIALEISACDASPTAIAHGTENARRAGTEIHFFRRDLLAEPLNGIWDIVVCSLFLHHLNESHAVELLAKLRGAARRLLIVNDLDRSPAGYGLAWIGTRLLSRSPVVHVDGPRSVAGAWTIPEAQALARRAGLQPVAFTRHWPCRWRMVWGSP